MTPADQTVYDFDLLVARPISDDELDALVEAGCDDSTPTIGAAWTSIGFDRAAPSLGAAIVSAVLDVEAAGLTVAGVGASDLVDLRDIAVRTGRSRESIRLLALGRRGPGGFPPARNGLHSWVAVREWFAAYDPHAVGSPDDAALEYDRVIAAADHLVRARALLRGDTGLAALVAA